MKILIPLDGSSNAERAVSHVVSQLGRWKEMPTVLLLNVQWKVATGNVKLFINQDTINAYYREQGMSAMQSACSILDAAHISYQYHISVGKPAEAIAQYAQEEGVDEIVMCRQGQGGVQQVLLGSVVNKVLHLAACPVLLVK